MKRNSGEGSLWKWSGVFDISSVDVISLQCGHVNKPMIFKLIRVEIKLIDYTAFIVF